MSPEGNDSSFIYKTNIWVISHGYLNVLYDGSGINMWSWHFHQSAESILSFNAATFWGRLISVVPWGFFTYSQNVSVMSNSQWSINLVSTVISNIVVEAKGFYPLLILVNELPTNFPAIWIYCKVLLWLKSVSLIFEFSRKYTKLGRLAMKVPTWQVLIEWYLTSLSLVHQLTLGLGWFS